MTNTITIDGRLTRDVELRFTPNGRAVANLGLAHNTQRYNKQTGEYEDGPTTFIDVALWGKKAENIADAASKGSVVLVTGSLRQESWEDKNGGGKRSKHSITAETIALVPTGQGQQRPQQGQGGFGQQQGGFGQQQPQQDPWASQPAPVPQDDDAPF